MKSTSGIAYSEEGKQSPRVPLACIVDKSKTVTGGGIKPAARLNVLPGTAVRRFSNARHFFASNLHRYSRHSAYDFSLRGVVKPPNILVGMRVGNYDQLASFCLPLLSTDFPLTSVNLHERTGADKGEKCVIFQPDIAVHRFA